MAAAFPTAHAALSSLEGQHRDRRLQPCPEAASPGRLSAFPCVSARAKSRSTSRYRADRSAPHLRLAGRGASRGLTSDQLPVAFEFCLATFRTHERDNSSSNVGYCDQLPGGCRSLSLIGLSPHTTPRQSSAAGVLLSETSTTSKTISDVLP